MQKETKKKKKKIKKKKKCKKKKKKKKKKIQYYFLDQRLQNHLVLRTKKYHDEQGFHSKVFEKFVFLL